MRERVKKLAVWLVGTMAVLAMFLLAGTMKTEAAGDDWRNAEEVGFNQTYYGSIEYKDQMDWYKVVLPSSGWLRIDVQAEIERYTFVLCAENDLDNPIWDNWVEWNRTTQISNDYWCNHFTSGTYYFRIQEYWWDGLLSGDYNFKLTFVSANESFRESQGGSNEKRGTASPIVLNKTYKGQLALNESLDFYKFTLDRATTVILNMSHYMGYIEYDLYDGNGNDLDMGGWSEWNSTTEIGNFQDKWELAKGSYYLVVRPKYDRCGRYEFSLASNGWKYSGGKTYYIDSDGSKHTGWLTLDKKRYYFGSDGVMKTGWASIGGNKYYFLSDGTMKTGLKTIGGKKYFFNSSTGAMTKGWATIGGKKYYFQSDGTARVGWATIGGKKYYFLSDCTMKTGWKTISGKRYFFNTSTGAMMTGWLAFGGTKYYMNPSTGAMMTGWLSFGSKKYYMDASGVMAKGWKTIKNRRYYFNTTSGVMHKGWLNFGSARYYMNPSTGVMCTGRVVISGKVYTFKNNGVLYK